MEMIYKDDWGKAKERINAWWQQEIVDRACIQVHASKGQAIYPQPPATIEDRWTNIKYVLDRAEASMGNTYYGGESFPAFIPNLGPDAFSAYYGCPLHFAPDTSWVDPIIKDWDTDIKNIQFDEHSHWWQLTQQMTAEAAERSKGNFIVGITDLHIGGDALSAMRGRQELCIDLYEHPEDIKSILDRLREDAYYVYDRLYELAHASEWGCSTWLPAWASDKYIALQCDFIIMISPKMFKEFFLPDIQQQAKRFDHSIFHLDGYGATRHLDDLLDIPELNAIQWVPGDGAEPMPYWIPLLKRIQAGKKSIHISARSEDVEVLLENLNPNGLMINTYARSIEEADYLLDIAAKMSVNKVR